MGLLIAMRFVFRMLWVIFKLFRVVACIFWVVANFFAAGES